MAFAVLGHEHLTNFGAEHRNFIEHHTPDDEGAWNWAAANIMFQYYLMGAGAFTYSIAWTDDFFILSMFRAITTFLMDFFEILGEWILPDDWTNNDAALVKICLAVILPIFVVLQANISRGTVQAADIKKRRANGDNTGKAGDRVYSHFGLILIYVVMPMLTIPVSATLFKPIVGCHLNVDSMNPAPVRPEDEADRMGSIDAQFMPVDQRNDCSFGTSTEVYMYVGIVLMIPFWMGGLYLGANGDPSSDIAFPIHKGFYVLHTQLMVLVAMSYRAFKLRHPMSLTVSITVLNLLSIALVAVYKPNDHLSLNRVRLAAAALAAMMSTCGLIAQLIDDRSSFLSAGILIVTLLVWMGGVVFLGVAGNKSASTGGDEVVNPANDEVFAASGVVVVSTARLCCPMCDTRI
jgi:hypothetical protein